jgi:hypothetical protein
MNNENSTAAHLRGHHPAFLVYPIIYVLCTAPLALGRIATMAGANVSMGYFCIAGALIGSNGWLDVLLWGITRRSLIFRAEVDTEEAGVETFAFMRTPHERRYGNMVWVEGAAAGRRGSPSGDEGDDAWAMGWGRERRGWRRIVFGRWSRENNMARAHIRPGSRQLSQESLRRAAAGTGRGNDMAIHLDLVTTVVYEETDKVDQMNMATQPSSYSTLRNGSDKNVPRSP